MSNSFPYIKDPILFRAVNFATKMVGDGRGLDRASEIAANYYKLNKDEVKNELKLRGLKDKNLDQVQNEGYSGRVSTEGAI